MDMGFETVGNATLVCHDRGPLLVTDPWLDGHAYFGSWALSHEIPAAQLESAAASPFVWVSHGHPDHLHAPSMERFRGRTILVPDHVGHRVAAALRDDGHRVQVLRDRTWTPISDRVRICCVADYNQDAVLLVDIGGCLVVDANDATDRGWRAFVRRQSRRFGRTFLLQLVGFGDADMINLFDESGDRIAPVASQRVGLGATVAQRSHEVGARYFIPFSAMHQYQRADSVWANEHLTGLDDYRDGFRSKTTELLPAFVRYDCLADTLDELRPARRPVEAQPPEAFGDRWDEPLERDDVEAAHAYFRAIEHIARAFDFVALRVGGEEHVIGLGTGSRRGITFEAPRRSLTTAIRQRVFDDMLIGNFMRTTLHGSGDPGGLYPDFTPFVAKYADNGGARTAAELDAYFAAYRRRAPFDYLRHRLERRSIDRFRSFVDERSPVYEPARRVYRAVSRGGMR